LRVCLPEVIASASTRRKGHSFPGARCLKRPIYTAFSFKIKGNSAARNRKDEKLSNTLASSWVVRQSAKTGLFSWNAKLACLNVHYLLARREQMGWAIKQSLTYFGQNF